MKTVAKILIFIIISLSAFTLLGLYVANWYGTKLLTDSLNGKTVNGLEYSSTLDASYFPQPYFSLQKFTFINPKHITHKLASIESFNFKFSWVPLLRNQFIVDELVIKGINIFIDIDKDGRSNWELKNATGNSEVKLDSSLPMHFVDNSSLSPILDKLRHIDKFLIKDFRIENTLIYYRDVRNNTIKRYIIKDFSIDNQNESFTVFNFKSALNNFILALHSKLVFSPTEKNIDFTDISVNLNNNNLTGNGTLLYKDAPYFELYLKGTEFNLDSITLPKLNINVNNASDIKNKEAPLQLVGGMSAKIDFKINKVTYSSTTYEDINYSLFLKNGSIHYVPCKPIWFKDFDTTLEQLNIKIPYTEKESKSQKWCAQ